MEISEERDLGVPNYIPMYNSEEKVDEINRLLEILSKRKKYSIVVSMLLVFQKFNYQKLLKDFLIQGVKDYIAANPFKVVSYNGVPFTVKNCFMGMRVIIGKHRIFQKEMIEGCEYLNVNLVYTCIFLSDEIAKICKGSKNSRPIHSSLLDELDIEEKDLQNLLNKKRGNNDESNDMFNDEMSNMTTDKKINGENEKNENNVNESAEPPKKKAGIINIGDSDSEGGRKKKLGLITNNLSNSNKNNGESKEKTKTNIMSNKTVFFPKDTGYLKCPLQDYLTVWNFGKSSPVNLYLKDNIQNLFKIRNIFSLMKEVGQKGQNYIESLSKYIPPEGNANKNEDETVKKITENLSKINDVYKEYNSKKKNLIQIYQRLKSTVENMKLGGYNPDKNLIEDDSEYLNMIGKKYDELLKEIYPLFNEIYNYDKECPIKSIGVNLFSLSKTLKENELIFRLFTVFSQNLVNLFPHEANNINTLSDLLMSDKLTEKEREEKFYEIAKREKENLLKSAEPIKKMAYDNCGNNTGENKEKSIKDTNSNDTYKSENKNNNENINENIVKTDENVNNENKKEVVKENG
jgi:hypothetical protein